MDWLKLRMKSIEDIRFAARAFARLTALAAVHSSLFNPSKAFSASTRSAFGALRRLGLFDGSFTLLYLPTSLGSTGISRFFATTNALTPTDSFHAFRRGSLLNVARTSDHSVSNHPRFSTSRYPLAPRWQLHFVGASPFPSGLARTADRIEFTLTPHFEKSSLRTGRSLPVALHPGISPRCSYFRLPALSVSRKRTFTALFIHALTGALGTARWAVLAAFSGETPRGLGNRKRLAQPFRA